MVKVKETQSIAEKMATKLGVIKPNIRFVGSNSLCRFNGNAHCHTRKTRYRRGTICINPIRFGRMDDARRLTLIAHEVSHLKPRKNHTHRNRTFLKAYKDLMVITFPLVVK